MNINNALQNVIKCATAHVQLQVEKAAMTALMAILAVIQQAVKVMNCYFSLVCVS